MVTVREKIGAREGTGDRRRLRFGKDVAGKIMLVRRDDGHRAEYVLDLNSLQGYAPNVVRTPG